MLRRYGGIIAMVLVCATILVASAAPAAVMQGGFVGSASNPSMYGGGYYARADVGNVIAGTSSGGGIVVNSGATPLSLVFIHHLPLVIR